MILNIITAELAVAFMVICVLSVMLEAVPPKKASTRNLLRRVKITLREIGFTAILLISAVLVLIALKTEMLKLPTALLSSAFFIAGYFILNNYRILCGLRSRRKKKALKPLGWILPSKEAKPTPEAGYLSEARETPVSPELSERKTL